MRGLVPDVYTRDPGSKGVATAWVLLDHSGFARHVERAGGRSSPRRGYVTGRGSAPFLRRNRPMATSINGNSVRKYV